MYVFEHFERIFEQENYSVSRLGQHLDTGCFVDEDHRMINVCRDVNKQEGVEGGGAEWRREMDGERERERWMISLKVACLIR